MFSSPEFAAQRPSAHTVSPLSIEEWGAFFVELAAGAEEGKSGRAGGVG